MLHIAAAFEIHWAFLRGKWPTIFEKIDTWESERIEWEEKRRKKETTNETCMSKGANQKSECTQICYDRSMTTVEGKKRREAEKTTSAEQKHQLNWFEHFEVCWRRVCAVVVVVRFKRNAFWCARQLDIQAETGLTDFDCDRAIKIADLRSNISNGFISLEFFSFFFFPLPFGVRFERYNDILVSDG